MKYEVKLLWQVGKVDVAKWFPVEAESEEEAKALALAEHGETRPGAKVVNITTIKD